MSDDILSDDNTNKLLYIYIHIYIYTTYVALNRVFSQSDLVRVFVRVRKSGNYTIY